MITVEALTKRYGGLTAVDDVPLTAAPGRVTGFLGPNGARKSTTIWVLVGLTAQQAPAVGRGGRFACPRDATHLLRRVGLWGRAMTPTMIPVACMLNRHLMSVLPELRYQPTLKRVRVRLGQYVVADTRRAVLVWEPRRVVPEYAVPEADVTATLVPASETSIAFPERPVHLGEGPPVLDPDTIFAVHTAPGTPLDVVTAGVRIMGGAFRPTDPDLDGLVVLDFRAFDWLEEDEPAIGHPRDPFHRIDVNLSTDLIRLEHQGLVLAESDRTQALFEGAFALVRYYLPREDVRVDLRPGTSQTVCAYKGRASHHTAVADGVELPNIAWSYDDPLPDAMQVRGMICFYQERLDLSVNGEARERQRTPWS